MAAYVVAYETDRLGTSYQRLVRRLESYARSWHLQQSAWPTEKTSLA